MHTHVDHSSYDLSAFHPSPAAETHDRLAPCGTPAQCRSMARAEELRAGRRDGLILPLAFGGYAVLLFAGVAATCALVSLAAFG